MTLVAETDNGLGAEDVFCEYTGSLMLLDSVAGGELLGDLPPAMMIRLGIRVFANLKPGISNVVSRLESKYVSMYI